MYKTGDVVRWRSDGRLEFIGRTDDQVKIRGFRIEPGEIEARLREHPLLAEAAVVACDRAPGDRQLAAYVTARMGAEPALAELRHFLRERLPEHMIPAAFIPLDTMPTTPSGKVDRRALPAPDWSRFALQGEYVAPRTETEQQLAAIWSDVLSIDRVGAHDNFFELGGNSLLALRLASQVRKSFSVDLPLVALFGAPTVIELAQRIVALRTSGRLLDVPPIQPVARGGPLPLSYGQEAMWVISRIQQGRSPYLMHPAARIRGALQLTALEHAFNEILRRHESLRTTFPEVDGQPVQAIAPYASRPLPVVDVSHLPPAEQEAEVRRYALRQSETPLDLATGPLARVEVIRLGEDEHVVLVGLHHIIYDGWSVAVLRRELLATYRAFAAGLPSPLPELPIQYADYAAWQRARLQGEVYEGLREYWRQKLADLPALELPIDHPRPKVRTTHAEATSCRLSSQLSRALKDLALREQATVFMVLLAAFQVLLRRYSGQEDFAIGTPIAGRLRPELENLIGYFVNTLVMRADLSADPTFRELISRVRKTALEGYDHQEMPFERLVQELKPDRDLSRHPLFQVLFVFQSVPFRAEEVSELELGNLETGLGERAADFELLLDATERGEELRLRLSYNRDLFAAATIARLLENFQVLLQAIADDPDRPITRLPLCSPEERRQVLVEWNRTDADYPNAASVHQLFEAQVERTPTEVAVVFEGQQLTYQELNARANQLARSLRSLGVGPDVPVGVCLERSLEMAVAIPAVLKAGGAYLPLDPEYPKQRLRVMLEDAQPAVVVTQQRLLASLPAFAAQRLLVDMDDSIRRRSPENPNWPTDATNLLYVLYTSGSTGRPKGVCLAHRPLVNLLMWQLSESGLGPGARTLQFTSLNFDPSFLEMFATWCAGGTLVMIDEQTRRDPGQLLRFIEQQRIERLYVPFVVLQQLAELGGEAELGDSLREINTAGEQLRVTPQLVDFFHRLGECKLQNQYGPTEAQVVTAHTLSGPPSQWVALPPIGRPLPNVRIYILDTHAQPVPIGVPGELYIGGHPLARGYLKRPDLTAEKFVPDPFASVADARMYRSGDLARWLPNGDIEFLGRADHQVKIRGFRVEPGEIEAVLHEHPSVRQAVVVVRESRAGDKRLVAFIVPDQEQPPTASQLRVFLQPKLPDYMIPAAFVPLPSLPLTPSGKTDRQALPEIGESQREATEAYVEPRTALERQLAEIWREFLHLDRVGIQDDFFELGGHSLLAVRLTARLCAELQVELPVAAVFTSPTVAELAARVAAARRGAQDQRPWELDALRGLTGALRPQETNGARSLVPLRDAASGTPLFCFHGLGGHVAAFLPLARQLQSERPVYGLQALGLAPGQTLHGRIEDMAAWYVEEIGSVQPAGPYLLCGWSLGGLIALESARQLHNAGHETALVAMFDTHLHAMGLDLPEMNDASVLQWIGRQLQVPQHELQRLPLPEQWDLIAERAERYAGLGAEEVRRLAAVCRAQLAAAAQYAPVPYSGCAVLFRASQTRARPDPRWQLLCPQLHVEEVPGNHFSLLRPPAVAVLAERLDRYLAAPESASVPGGGP
jgi:amino acid adenylation domain-containing protein